MSSHNVLEEIKNAIADDQVTALTTITHTAPSSADYALQDLVTSGTGYGFATKDEGNSLLAVVKNLQQRVALLEGGS